ncbi:MAG: sel1 repeat family protein [Synergistaceae bacterium]|nr:sel1 repeat family protein [Synergistaceae bacterium]MBQ4401378.1 sel1 repeat family protein [Synergistaceae bacterium]MBQ6665604.1 sel1 repeat family protein [Synergistaceae bacterium]MBQ6983280.1 sel1 repeat family protein [Synergistaceae bacterium]MBR0247632.1 sel1 repeat family protein [Synergistaceae bacterium]
MPDYDPLLTMSALNMAVVSLHRITSSGDRLTLDREYTNIINNIRMGEINDDPELTGLYKEIVRVIHRGRLRDELRSEMSESYSNQQKKSIGEIISGNISRTFSLNPLQWLGKLASSSASEYFASLKEEGRLEQKNEDDNLRLKHEELDEYDELQRNLLGASWSLLRQYHLSDSYRLTQEALVKFSAAIKASDPSKRHRMLKHIEGDFSVYSPYWFYRAKAAHETGNDEEAEKYFAKFQELWRPVLRKDPYRAEAVKFRIEGLMQGGFTLTEKEEILGCLAEMRANTPLEDWANNIYMGMMYFTLGDKEKAIDCVMPNVDYEYETENSEGLIEKFENETPPTRFEIVKPLAEQGNAKAQYIMGCICYQGEGVTQDKSGAVEWFRKAAEQGHAVAQFNLGVFYEDGKDITQDYEEAVKWYRKSAEQGDARAQNSLGIMYKKGKGVIQDWVEAVRWFRKAAGQGNAMAQYNVGWVCENGEGVTQDTSEAVKWYRKAAQQGHGKAQEALKRLGETW